MPVTDTHREGREQEMGEDEKQGIEFGDKENSQIEKTKTRVRIKPTGSMKSECVIWLTRIDQSNLSYRKPKWKVVVSR